MAEYQPVTLTLPSIAPTLALEVLPHGLLINRIFVQADGRTHDIVVGPEDPADHANIMYHNTIIGRYSNRIPVGTHPMEKNGIKGEMTAIANISENDLVSLHGGPIGFDSLVFTPLTPSEVTLFSKAELATLATDIPGDSSSSIWRLVSEDGDQGFPGRLTVEVLVGLIESTGTNPEVTGELDLGSIFIVYRAKVEEKNGEATVTPVNLTQHWGFNLDASLKEGLSVKDHKLTIKASNTLERDALNLPTGNLPPVAGAHVHDGKKIGESFPDEGYDDFYVLSSSTPLAKRIPLAQITDPSSSLDLLKPILGPLSHANSVLELNSAKSGLKLNFETNQSGLQFYTYNFASPEGYRKKIHGGSGNAGDGYTPGSAAFIEFHEPLSAFLYPSLQQGGDDTLLISDEVYNNFVKLRVSAKHIA